MLGLILLAVLFAQSAGVAPSDPLGPLFDYLLSFGVLGAVVVAAMFGRLDLRPSVMRQLYEDQRTMNASLVAGLNEQVLPAMNATTNALEAATLQLAAQGSEIAALRLEMARRGQ